MSLTARIKHRAFKNLRKWFIYHFPNPGLDYKSDNVITSQKTSSSYSGDIGTAFDYLFRFKIEQNNKTLKATGPESWVAYTSYKNLKPRFKKIAKPKFELAVRGYEDFINDNVINDELFDSCLFLNQLDICYRTGHIFEEFGNDDIDKREELKSIFENVDWSKFNSNSNYILNPVFEGLIENVNADADLIMDKTLIELKCVSQIKIQRFQLNQLLGYYFLNLLKPKKEQYDIDSIAIYFARADYLWEMKLEDYYPKKELIKRAKEFEKLMVNPSLDLLPENPGKRSVTNSIEQQEIYDNVMRIFKDYN